MNHQELKNQELLAGLRAELKLLNDGGHQYDEGWRPYSIYTIFEDSALCTNPLHINRPATCKKCQLMAFVPKDKKQEAIPCQHIPLNDGGLTPHNLLHWGTQEQTEAAIRLWLEKTIGEVERKYSHPVH